MNARMKDTAEQHRQADAACGRDWVCCCAACMAARYTTAAALATELDRAPDRIGAIARRLGFARIGRDWLFTRQEADAIRKFVKSAKPGRKAKER